MNRSTFGLLPILVGFLCSLAAADCVLPDDPNFASQGGGCTDLATGNVWSVSITKATGSLATQAGAQHYCNNLIEGAQSDWRLPRIDELQLVGSHGGGNYLDLNYGSIDNLAHWSSNVTKNKKYADIYRFGSNTTARFSVQSFLTGICVRTGGASAAAASVTSVPEPGSLLLGAFGAVGLLMRRMLSR